jgi:hypothetical protein
LHFLRNVDQRQNKAGQTALHLPQSDRP